MRRPLVLWTVLMLSLATGLVSVRAQAIRYAAPPITRIDLNAYEPAPPGIPTDIFYGGLGGGAGELILIPERPTWDSLPGALATGYGAYFSACGYRSSTPPAAALIYPGGAQVAIELNHYEDGSHCYDYSMEWTYGMELGIYILTFNHPEGNLTHTFGYDYPFCWNYVPTRDGLEWLMGLAPDEQITLYFYAFSSTGDFSSDFVAQRNVRADASGAIVLDIQVGRTAPFERSDIFFATIGIGRQYYPVNPALDGEAFAELGFVYEPYIAPEPAYSHLSVGASIFSAMDARGISCDGDFERFAQPIMPQSGASIPLYDRISGTSATGTVSPRTVVEILESQPAYSSGRVHVWKRLRLEDGRTGWTSSNDFISVYAYPAPGVRAEIQPGALDNGDGTYRAGPQPVYDQPTGRWLREIQPETEVVLMESTTDSNGNEWWRIRLPDGAEAWLPSYDGISYSGTFEALAWPPTGSSTRGAAPVTTVCPGSPLPRLSPGDIGRVLPGDPNRLRAAPESGRVLDNIPGGATFTVLAGPQCGPANGLAWWQVEFNGQVGWTAEGQGSTYWLEPGS
ncbi:MAG: hypothetical protein IPK19_33150 [Chloroflexi bacterium]|nr:hypothetical protein [Chloroflexota bacterium]